MEMKAESNSRKLQKVLSPPQSQMKSLAKNLDGKYTRILHAILNKSWKQHSTAVWPLNLELKPSK